MNDLHKVLTPCGYDTYRRWVNDQGAVRDAGFAAWPLGLESLRIAGGESARGTRDGVTEVLLDGRRAPDYALTAAGSTHAEGGPNPTGRLRRRVLLFPL